MYDFIDFSQGTNFYMNLYCFLLYCVLLLTSLRGNVLWLNVQESYRGRTWILAVGLLLFALTCFMNEDFFHYQEVMSLYKDRVFGDQEAAVEEFYQYLIYYINGDYFLFRLVVWGSSLALIILAARKFGANVYHTLFIVLAGFIVTYSYARATLAMATFSLGAVMICMAVDKRWKVIPLIIGMCIVASSIYFHRSMLPMIALAMLWLFIPWKKTVAKYSMWLFPLFVALFYVVIKIAFEELFTIAEMVDDESGTMNKFEIYAEKEAVKSNVKGYIHLALQYSTFYLPMFILSTVFRSDKVLQIVDKRVIWLYSLACLMVAFATSLLFLDMDNSILFYRYLFMTFIPLSILIAYTKDTRVLQVKLYRWIIYFSAIYNFLQLFAFVYNAI